MHLAPKLDARALAALYDEGYYHGVGSGYPAAGYEHEHATWTHWVAELGARYSPRARWLDLGCAYGYLVAEASSGGFVATGVDVSQYALRRVASEAPSAGGRVARAVLETLPFADGSFDVVSAFDVLEHLVDPEPALREAHRVLRPGGTLIGATPDPLVFDRHEDTHLSERPPSYWIDRLLALGFEVDFRFYQEPYNLEFAAIRAAAPCVVGARRLHVDKFGDGAELGSVRGSLAHRAAVRVRGGFEPAGPDHPEPIRWVGAGGARAYVVVTGREPVALAPELEVRAADGHAELAIALDDQHLGDWRLGSTWRTVHLDALPVAAGGHHLRLGNTGAVFVRSLTLAVEPTTRAALVRRLPFDMFQRYDQCRAVASALGVRDGRILDVGGVLGGAGGHLATGGDFFPEATLVSTDVQGSDHPEHRRVSGAALPFPDASFDVVLCLDVLEHVPAPERAAFQAELARVSRRFVLLAAPFATEGVAAADAFLFELIRARHGYAHTYLAEHLAHRHPDLDATIGWWRDAGAAAVALPNGYLPYWTHMQVLNLELAAPHMGERYAAGQALYNDGIRDWREPAYRHLLVIDRSGKADWREAVLSLADEHDAVAAPARLEPSMPPSGALAREAAVISRILDLAYAAGARGGDDDSRTTSVASSGNEAAQPPSGGEVDPAERERVRALEALADRVWSHPLYRGYGVVRRALRALTRRGA